MWNTIKKYWVLIVGGLVAIIGFIFKEDIRSKVIQEIDRNKKENDIKLDKSNEEVKKLVEDKKDLEVNIKKSKEVVKDLKEKKEKVKYTKPTEIERAKRRLREIAQDNNKD